MRTKFLPRSSTSKFASIFQLLGRYTQRFYCSYHLNFICAQHNFHCHWLSKMVSYTYRFTIAAPAAAVIVVPLSCTIDSSILSSILYAYNSALELLVNSWRRTHCPYNSDVHKVLQKKNPIFIFYGRSLSYLGLCQISKNSCLSFWHIWFNQNLVWYDVQFWIFENLRKGIMSLREFLRSDEHFPSWYSTRSKRLPRWHMRENCKRPHLFLEEPLCYPFSIRATKRYRRAVLGNLFFDWWKIHFLQQKVSSYWSA